MFATEVWYASPDVHDVQAVVNYVRIAAGPGEALDLLRDAEKLARERAVSPDASTPRLLVLVDQPGRLFSDERYGLLLQARVQSLSRAASRENGVRLEVRW
jgi:hypothetical protein